VRVMRHPGESTLRRLVDEPAGVADADREHVAGCPVCLSGLAAAREGAAPVVVSAPRWRAALRSPLVAAVAVVVLVAGASVAAAADWLQIFRTERIAPIAITEADLLELPDLSAYGDVEITEEADVRAVADADAVAKATGLSVPRVGELPRGVTAEPAFRIGGPVSAVFTFSAAKAERAAAKAGEALPPPPAGLDGSRFRLVAGPGFAAVWPDARGVPALIVARAVAPTVYSSGVPFQTARDYVLSLPGVPKDVAAQLREFSGDGTTLPLPVPAGLAESSTADVDGVPARVLSSRDGTMVAVIWADGGTITAVAGSLSADELLSVARGLR
jgi:hypothetical protein